MGGRILYASVIEMSDKKNKKYIYLALYGRQSAMAYTTTNQKQTSVMKKIMERVYDWEGTTREGVLHCILRA
jgi:hypothetical protein